MKSKNGETLFTISQAAKACGISRSTLMRLEKRGLFTPTIQSETSGYRYYSTSDIHQIIQIQYFIEMGLGTREIIDYYSSGGDSTNLLSSLERKLQIMQQTVDEIRLRTEKENHLSFEIVTLPETVCCVREGFGRNVQARCDLMQQLAHDMTKKGIRHLASQPVFVINKRTDFLEGRWKIEPVEFTCCIPVEPSAAPSDAVVIPGCQAISLLCFGSYAESIHAYLTLGSYVREHNLTPAGFERSIGLVTPYTGKQILEKNYVTRFALPIEKEQNPAW
ncbi:MAG: MerR family transcriptional regulator [Lachnospiraceae bacterium]|nr:MerR family transcriptional regulator [Lachnospiraceae bacterium]